MSQHHPPEASAEPAAVLAELARSMAGRRDLQHTLDAVVGAARTTLPSFDHVGIWLLARRGEVRTVAATSELVRELDALQHELAEGPCFDCTRDVPLVSAPRIRHDQRWPRYVPLAVRRTGLRSQLAVRLHLDEVGTVGSLNFYSTITDDVDDSQVAMAELFATHAALALGGARAVADLNHALESRRVIGVAIGLVMARYRVDEDAAFAFLTRASSHTNRKLRDIATEMVEHANRERADSPGTS
ncbi:GAF and ANTAR domain-containing protein [Nocardioides marmoraquaticus]